MSSPHITSRRSFLQTASAAAVASIGLPARAQSDFPKGQLKLIVGLPPGGAADIIARTGAALLEKSLKQAVVVENKPGGQFQISMQALLNAPACCNSCPIWRARMYWMQAVAPASIRTL